MKNITEETSLTIHNAEKQDISKDYSHEEKQTLLNKVRHLDMSIGRSFEFGKIKYSLTSLEFGVEKFSEDGTRIIIAKPTGDITDVTITRANSSPQKAKEN